MSWKSKYNIEFKGLKEGVHDFEFDIDNKFFAHFDDRLVDNGKVSIIVILEKRSTFLKLDLKINGWLELTCDRCLDIYQQPIANEFALFVKFGENQLEENENVIWVLPEEHAINLAQTIYEYVSLSIPLRHIHPKNSNGKRACNREMIEKLKQLKHPGKEEEHISDPRWNALKGIVNNN